MGYPVRPSRNALGPTLIDYATPTREDTDIPAAKVNLAWWQIAGVGMTAPLAWVLIGSAGALIASGEAWNPNADISLRPTVARVSAGVYTATYATTYADEQDIQQPLSLIAVSATVQTNTANRTVVGRVELESGHWLVAVHVAVGSTGAATDADVYLEVR